MGDGDLLKRNALQLPHTAYNLSHKYEADEWATSCTLLTSVSTVNVEYNVMTRW